MRSLVAGRVPLVVLGSLLCLAPPAAEARELQIQWQAGPHTARLGDDVATVSVPDSYVFADAADTRKLMEAMGNSVDSTEVGMISPASEDEDWLMLFQYKKEGYVKDDDKNAIDKDAILESYKAGTEEGNKRRQAKGIPGLHVTGWFQEPYYDQATHNLVWALRARSDDGSEVVNYNVRLLGREGYMSVTLVDEPAKIAASKPRFQKILSSFAYEKGRSYAEFRPGDKVAQYGLVALVAGGAGAAAAKVGLFAALGKVLAKSGKAVVALLVGIGIAIKKLFSFVLSRGESEVTHP